VAMTVPLPPVALPRFTLATLPTPLVQARRLERVLGGRLLVKRDDLTGFGAAGNKARQLEYLVGAAVAEQRDVLVTGGGPGSNFCPAAAGAARAAGMECTLVVYGDPPAVLPPNLALARACGARLRFTGAGRDLVDAAIEQEAQRLAAEGRRPVAVPRGGSSPVGAVGFAAAATEVVAQLEALRVEPAVIVVATGSGGTQAGLLAGLAGCGKDWRVVGVSVSRPLPEITSRVWELTQACAAILQRPPPSRDRVELVDARRPEAQARAIRRRRLALETEGLLLDETYTARSFAVAADLLATTDGTVVFWHTGGLVPALTALTGRLPH